MKSIVTVAALATLLCGPALAQNTGPAPQTGMEKPGTTSGAKSDGSMEPPASVRPSREAGQHQNAPVTPPDLAVVRQDDGKSRRRPQ